MFEQIAEDICKFFREETLAERSKRMLPGAMYCAIAATVYVMASPFFNVIFFFGLASGGGLDQPSTSLDRIWDGTRTGWGDQNGNQPSFTH